MRILGAGHDPVLSPEGKRIAFTGEAPGGVTVFVMDADGSRRRTSGGTDGETGSRLVDRVLSVVTTRHQQGRRVLEYLTRCHRARLPGLEAPSLVEMKGSVSPLAG